MTKKPVEGYQLSLQQKHIWRLQRSGLSYRSRCAILIKGRLDVCLLKQTVTEMIGRHETLRTTFHETSEMLFPVQVVNDSTDFDWREVDLRQVDQSEQQACIRKYFEETGSAVDFSSGPLVHLTLLNLSPDEHTLLIDLPALCADAQTLKNIFDEIAKSYTAVRRGEQFSRETMQYVDFCEWQDGLVSGYDEEIVDFWRQRTPSLFEDLRLPFETHQAMYPPGEPHSSVVTIEFEARSQAEELARRCETTIPACLLACWQVLLWRLTKEAAITVGVRFDGRKYEELQNAVGLFAQRLPIQTHLQNTLTFVEVVEQVKESSRDAHRRQEYFSLEETLGPPQDAMSPPAYSIGFDYDEVAETYVDNTGLSFSINSQETCLDRCKVELRCISAGESLRLEFWYDSALLEIEYVEQMARCFCTLLESAAHETTTTIEALSLIGETDRHKLVAEFNETTSSYRADQTFIQLFEAQAERTPDEIAVVFEQQRLSYAELNSQANQLASYLRRRGAGANTLIGLCVGRSLEMIVGLLGILKTGGGYVPLDPDLPRERLVHLIAEIQSPVLIIEERYLNHVPPAEIFVLNRDRALFANEPRTNPPAAASPPDVAYVIYTSGSTGVPKGVVVTNQNLVNYTSFICRQLEGLTRKAKLNFATVSTLTADLGNTSIFPALASGGCLHVVSHEVATDANLFARYNSEHAIDVLKIVPAHLRGLLPAGRGVLPRTCLIVGGETFSFDLLRHLEELEPECEIINHYGPTEATIGAALFQLKNFANVSAVSASVSIGKPIANTQIYILDKHGAPVPLGIPGELHIAGDGLALGYLNQPEQTAEKFIPNPFSPFAARMYRTGDLARYLSDGSIEYLGRIDQQVKIRGFRIELGEIEAALGNHPDVSDSVVVAREDAAGDKSLTAYVVVKQLPANSFADGEGPLYQLPNGMQVAQQNKHETDFFYRQIFIEQSNLKHGMTLPDNACVFDVGANIGLFTLYIHQHCPSAAIYSFEPSPHIFNLLRQNAARYRVNAHLFECGLSSENKVVPFTFYPEESCMSGFYADNGYDKATLKSIMVGQFKNEAGRLLPQPIELESLVHERTRSESFSCQLRTLSEIVADEKIECIDLLKIDVEKSESDVLAGINENDWNKIRQLVIEAHDLDGRVERISDLLRTRSYDVHVEQDALLNGTDLFNIYAVRLPSNGAVASQPATVAQTVPQYHTESVSSSELRTFLETRLPHYMVPSTLVLMDSLPLTRNGKIDRRALPLPDSKQQQTKNGYIAPRNHVEEVLASVWSQVLRVERVGIDDNFFALGGDSIRSIQIRYRAQERGLELLPRDFFALPTIRQLAEVTRSEVAAAMSTGRTELFSLISEEDRRRLPTDIVDAYPLAMLQAGMIFHSEYSAGSTTYLDIIGYHIKCRYDLHALQAAIEQLVKRHDVLRTSFDQDNYTEPLQLVHREVTVNVEVEDLSHLSVAEQTAELAEWMERAKYRKFDLSRPPLLRVTVHLRSADTFQLTLSHHHAILDGWSNSSLTAELLQRYLCVLDHRPYFKQPLKSGYRDFVALERATVASEEHRHFWEERLRDSSVMTLPRWSAPPLDVGRKLRRLHVPISIELSEKLKDVGLRIGVPVKSVLLAAHFKVMSLLAGQEDILTGVVAHGRSEIPDGDLVLGLYLNSVPFRKRLTTGSWLELARGLFENEQELQPFQSYPLAEIQRRRGERQPLFETLFNFSHFHVFNELIRQEGIEFLGVESFEETNFTLLANFTTDLLPAKIRLDLSYDANVLSDELLEAIGSYYSRTLEAIASDPTARYAMFSPLSFAEREQLLRRWNDTGSGSRSDDCLHQLFEAQVKQFPDQLALVLEDVQLTYRELNKRANQMARYLQTLGVGTESHVGIYLQRSIETAIAVLAVLKAGGTYIPIDPEYPPDRIVYILSDARLQALLTQQSLLPTLPLRSAPVVCVDSWSKSIELQSGDDLNPFVLPGNLAYITYTSGSTGQPKGVALPQRVLTNLIEWHLSALAGGVRTLQFAPLGFDLSFYEMFVTWLSGGTLYLMREELRRDVPGLARYLLKHEIQKIVLPVVLLQELAEECEAQEIVLADLLEVISSGEQLHITKAIVEFFQKLPACKLHNHYGPSETHAATAYELDNDPQTWKTHPSIGRPISATQIYLLDQHLNPVPLGVAGELYIGGTSIARGYLNRPDLTAEKFVPNHFDQGGSRLYRTGDLARYATDGNIEFLGRVDHQIKIRGYRIELGEIEAVLGQHPDIRDVVVIAHESELSSEKSLIAYVVPEQVTMPVESISVGELKAFLKNKLPEYMVPSAFVMLQSLPLTSNNKIDYRALAAMDHVLSDPAKTFTPARTPTEEIIAGIWSEVLGVEQIGIHDGFLELGGHSLKATQIASRIRSSFRIELPLQRIFECSSVAALSASLDVAGSTDLPAMITAPGRIPRNGAAMPLSFGQQRLWFLSQLKSKSAFYNVAGAVRLNGALDITALSQSLNEVGRRHAVLRTTFKLIDGSPVQVIAPDSNFLLPVIDLSELPVMDREAEVQRIAASEARRLFDLASGPLMRVSILRCTSEDHVLLMTLHHIVSDGWSRGVLIKELTALYQAFSSGEQLNLPELPMQYADFAVWQREWFRGEVLQRQLDYWKKTLHAAPSVMSLPMDRPRPAVQTFRSGKLSVTLPESLSTALRKLSRREGVTLFMTLLAAFETLLYRYSGESDLVIGTTIANRRWQEIEGLIGFFTNSLVLRTDLSGNPSFRELLRRVRKVTLDAYAHQDLPFEKLVEELKIERKLSHTPLFQVVFSFQNSPAAEVNLPHLLVSPMEIDSGSAMFDLILGIVDTGEKLTGVLIYSTDLFEAATARRLFDDLTLLLEEVVAHPDKLLLDLELDRTKTSALPIPPVLRAGYEVERFEF